MAQLKALICLPLNSEFGGMIRTKSRFRKTESPTNSPMSDTQIIRKLVIHLLISTNQRKSLQLKKVTLELKKF